MSGWGGNNSISEMWSKLLMFTSVSPFCVAGKGLIANKIGHELLPTDTQKKTRAGEASYEASPSEGNC